MSFSELRSACYCQYKQRRHSSCYPLDIGVSGSTSHVVDYEKLQCKINTAGPSGKSSELEGSLFRSYYERKVAEESSTKCSVDPSCGILKINTTPHIVKEGGFVESQDTRMPGSVRRKMLQKCESEHDDNWQCSVSQADSSTVPVSEPLSHSSLSSGGFDNISPSVFFTEMKTEHHLNVDNPNQRGRYTSLSPQLSSLNLSASHASNESLHRFSPTVPLSPETYSTNLSPLAPTMQLSSSHTSPNISPYSSPCYKPAESDYRLLDIPTYNTQGSGSSQSLNAYQGRYDDQVPHFKRSPASHMRRSSTFDTSQDYSLSEVSYLHAAESMPNIHTSDPIAPQPTFVELTPVRQNSTSLNPSHSMLAHTHRGRAQGNDGIMATGVYSFDSQLKEEDCSGAYRDLGQRSAATVQMTSVLTPPAVTVTPATFSEFQDDSRSYS